MSNPLQTLREGYTKIPNKFIQRSDLSGRATRVYLLLASFTDAYPSYGYMQKVLGMSRATVWKAIKELAEKNLISIKSGRTKGNAQSNRYDLVEISDWVPDVSKTKLVHKMNQDVSETKLGVVPELNPTKEKLLKKSLLSKNQPKGISFGK